MILLLSAVLSVRETTEARSTVFNFNAQSLKNSSENKNLNPDMEYEYQQCRAGFVLFQKSLPNDASPYNTDQIS
jgi:hypothetical protein